ncbi:MAG TPA: YicC family protein [Deltaproteobacteria bacterium]|nr:YicC family protein [Deltaproteobacteria bacterium]
MIKSMTAYGRGEYQDGSRSYICEMKSVNNRHKDILLRTPRNLQPIEESLRLMISSTIGRGRVEATIQIEKGENDLPYELEINKPLVDAYLGIFQELAERSGLAKDVGISALIGMRDVILTKTEESDLDEIKPWLVQAIQKSLDSLMEMKLKEGHEIEKDFNQRISLLEGYLDKIHERAPGLVQEYRTRLIENVKKMIQDLEVDEERISRETALFADRSDITEEIVRAKSHFKQFRTYLADDDAVGRRLDFLIQEINREVNTLSVKSCDAEISRIVVEMKSELEKIREQTQNVE